MGTTVDVAVAVAVLFVCYIAYRIRFGKIYLIHIYKKKNKEERKKTGNKNKIKATINLAPCVVQSFVLMFHLDELFRLSEFYLSTIYLYTSVEEETTCNELHIWMQYPILFSREASNTAFEFVWLFAVPFLLFCCLGLGTFEIASQFTRNHAKNWPKLIKYD